MNLNKLFKSLSIRNKFLVAFLSLSILPALLIGLYGLRTTEKALVKSFIQQRKYDLEELIEKLKYISGTIKDDLITLYGSPLYSELLTGLEKGKERGIIEWTREIEEEMDYFVRKKDYLVGISYLNREGEEIFKAYSDDRAKSLSKETWRWEGLKKILNLQKGQVYIQPPKISGNYVKVIHDIAGGIFLYSSPVYDLNNRKRGILSFSVSSPKLLRPIKEIYSKMGSTSFIIDNNGHYLSLEKDNMVPPIISQNIPRLLSGSRGVLNKSKDNEIIVYSPIYWNGLDKREFWLLGLIVPKKAIMDLSGSARRLLLNLLLLIIFFSTILGILAARQFSNPIRKLREGVKTIASVHP